MLPRAALGLCAATLACALLPVAASAQNPPSIVLPDLPAASAAAAASAPGPRPPPRLRSPAETGGGAAAPGDLKPERPVSPQISIPFGKKAPPPSPREERIVDQGLPSSTSGVDDAIARCDSEVVAQLRADCRARIAKQNSASAPR